MRVLIQRVLSAQVTINYKIYSQINQGLLLFIGIHKDDDASNIPWLTKKCVDLRIFEDENQKMNLSIDQVQGEILIVSQFTLYGSCHAGKRPEFTQTAKSMHARRLYEDFISNLKSIYPKVQTGIFGEDMKVTLTNDGPVTFLIEK